MEFFLWFIWDVFSLNTSGMNNLVGFGMFVFFSSTHFIIISICYEQITVLWTDANSSTYILPSKSKRDLKIIF